MRDLLQKYKDRKKYLSVIIIPVFNQLGNAASSPK